MSDFQTPSIICDLMVSKLPDGVKTVLEPTPGDGNIVRALSEYDVCAPQDFWNVFGFFDAVVMNPPFSPMKTGYDILYRSMTMTNVIIALMPWLTIINSERRTRDILDYGLRGIIHLPRRVFSGSRVQTCILIMNKGYTGNIELEFVNYE